MKHRHTRQQQRLKTASRNGRLEVDKTAEEQPSSGAGKAKRRAAHHMHAEGKRPEPRLDKFRRGGRRPKRFDDGGVAGGAGSTRPNDPGNEIAGADRDRPKSTLERLGRELMGPKSAYKRGGRQRSRKYDAGGAAPSVFSPPTQQDLITTPKQNYVASLVQKSVPPIDRAGQIMAARAAAIGQQPKSVPSFPGAPKIPVPVNKQGGRVKRGSAR